MGAHDLFVDGNQERKNRVRRAGQDAAPARASGDAIGILAHMQRSAGNAAVGALLRQYAVQRAAVPKEEEELQMKRDDGSTAIQREGLPEEEELQMKRDDSLPVQRAAAPEEEEELQMKREGAMVMQRAAAPEEEGVQEEEEELQMKREGATGDGVHAPVGLEGGPLHPAIAERIQAKRGGGSPLDTAVRTSMESTLGTSLSDVKVHADTEADALNRSVSAVAFTTGSDIFFKQGAYNPASGEGQQLLAHELTHVVQQRSMSGGSGGGLTVGPAGDSYEQQADATAAAVARAVDDESPELS